VGAGAVETDSETLRVLERLFGIAVVGGECVALSWWDSDSEAFIATRGEGGVSEVSLSWLIVVSSESSPNFVCLLSFLTA